MYPMNKYQFAEYSQYNKDGSESKVVVAISKHRGKSVRGIAKCLETDTFSFEKGKELAAARCDYKVCCKKRADAEKAKARVAKQLESLNNKYIKMCKKCGEVNLEVIDASKRLSRIEEELE